MKEVQSMARRLKEQFNRQFPCIPPVGSVIGWHKNLFTSVPVLPDNWMECNGQVVIDMESPLYNKTLPILNSQTRMLKGGLISGILETIGLKNFSNFDAEMKTSSVVWIIRIK